MLNCLNAKHLKDVFSTTTSYEINEKYSVSTFSAREFDTGIRIVNVVPNFGRRLKCSSVTSP